MAIFQYAQGHNNGANLAVFPITPRMVQDLEYDVEYTGNGVAKRVGGATVRLQWDYLEYDELTALMQYLGVSHRESSTQGTFLLQDWFNIPSVWNGQVTLNTPRRNVGGFYENVTADITGLVYA